MKTLFIIFMSLCLIGGAPNLVIDEDAPDTYMSHCEDEQLYFVNWTHNDIICQYSETGNTLEVELEKILYYEEVDGVLRIHLLPKGCGMMR